MPRAPRPVACEVVGREPPAPIVTADHVSKWYGQVIGLNDVSVDGAARGHGTARPQRRRQVDVHEADHRAAQPEQGHRESARRADLAQPASVFPDRVLSRTGRLLRAHDRARVGAARSSGSTASATRKPTRRRVGRWPTSISSRRRTRRSARTARACASASSSRRRSSTIRNC